MWLRLALSCPIIILLSACSPSDRHAVDKLNSLSYAYHYRNLDSTECYARQALTLSEGMNDCDGKAEALNNLAFVEIARMHYDDARNDLDRVTETTDNQLELLIAYIQQMRLCQRLSFNREFYDCREQAQTALQRINEERHLLTPRQHRRLLYAESEMAIVTSTYYYYVGLERQSVEEMMNIPSEVEEDTIQFLNYLYNVGAGGVTRGTQQEINQAEFDYLLRCFLLSRQADCPYFAANSLEALAELLSVDENRRQLVDDNQPAFKFINPNDLPEEMLPLWLADSALMIFKDYRDTYQIAGAYRTLATCFLAQNDYESALFNLEQALSDTLIYQAPDLVASIHEQLSVAYSAIDQKSMSDYNRNAYLDLQERTRQDQRLEARAAQLESSLTQLNQLLVAVVIAVIALIVVVWLFYLNRKRAMRNLHDDATEDRREELEEQLALTKLHIEQGKRLHVEQRAKISLVNGLLPFIDRMIHEEKTLSDDFSQSGEQIDYIRELIDNINSQNDILTHWIQLQKGEVCVHIETFALQELFDIVAKGRRSFSLKGIDLTVQPTALSVKADKVLTLFMLNTLADNARKFTPQGGRVEVCATDAANYVEVSVSDTGAGMTEEQLAHVFDRKVITDGTATSHGFGLLNCKGIIEKYRKLSQIFSVCVLAAESQKGKGSRFYFRLPKKLIAVLAFTVMLTGVSGYAIAAEHQGITLAAAYSDSAYYSNINGTYGKTLLFADSCRHILNNYFRQVRQHRNDTLLLLGDMSTVPPEIRWLHDSVDVDYNVLLEMRNECAVAALALHEWRLYHYNNRIYTQLFKELSADATLDSYCRTMQQSQSNKQVAIILLVFLFLTIITLVAWQLMMLHNKKAGMLQEKQRHLDLMADDLQRLRMEEAALHVSNAVLDNTLSTLKHETMYYPSRIRQLLDIGDRDSLVEVTAFYRELYGILSQQAMWQLDHVKLHLQALPHEILGDAVCVEFLFDILRKQSGDGNRLVIDWQSESEQYMRAVVNMPGLKISDDQMQHLFLPGGMDNIPFLICREIVRQHGEATNRHACGIRAERTAEDLIQIIIILPRICKNLKSLS